MSWGFVLIGEDDRASVHTREVAGSIPAAPIQTEKELRRLEIDELLAHSTDRTSVCKRRWSYSATVKSNSFGRR
jgi:hypothetical protein